MALLRILKQIVVDCTRSVIPARLHPEPKTWSNAQVTLSWLGHATVLLNFRGLVILTDPIFLARVGFRLGPLVLGPKRYIACALKPHELPPIDLVLLSHAHLDHLDLASLKALPKNCVVVTAKHTADVFRKIRFQTVVEIDWNQTRTIETAKGSIQITGKRLRHWGARTRTDTHRRYNAFVLERDGIRICFAGDTAHTDTSHLAEHGPIDLLLVPIGAYDPWIQSHCTPEQARSMADQAQAQYLIPIHHQTFRLSNEPMEEPISRFRTALADAPERLGLTEIGQTFVLPKSDLDAIARTSRPSTPFP